MEKDLIAEQMAKIYAEVMKIPPKQNYKLLVNKCAAALHWKFKDSLDKYRSFLELAYNNDYDDFFLTFFDSLDFKKIDNIMKTRHASKSANNKAPKRPENIDTPIIIDDYIPF